MLRAECQGARMSKERRYDLKLIKCSSEWV